MSFEREYWEKSNELFQELVRKIQEFAATHTRRTIEERRDEVNGGEDIEIHALREYLDKQGNPTGFYGLTSDKRCNCRDQCGSRFYGVLVFETKDLQVIQELREKVKSQGLRDLERYLYWGEKGSLKDLKSLFSVMSDIKKELYRNGYGCVLEIRTGFSEGKICGIDVRYGLAESILSGL